MVESAKHMHRVCGHVQAVLSRTGFLAAEEEDENMGMDDTDEVDAQYIFGAEPEEVAVGVQWSETIGSYLPSSGCTEHPIPRGEPSATQLDAIRKRQRVDNVERDETGNARIFANGWLVGRPLRSNACRSCGADLKNSPNTTQVGSAVIHSVSNSFHHEIHAAVCQQCGEISLWEPHQDAIHMISNSEGGIEQQTHFEHTINFFLLCVQITMRSVYCVYTITYCVQRTVCNGYFYSLCVQITTRSIHCVYTITYCVQRTVCNLLCAQLHCLQTRSPKNFFQEDGSLFIGSWAMCWERLESSVGCPCTSGTTFETQDSLWKACTTTMRV